jgi:hypothetical protein
MRWRGTVDEGKRRSDMSEALVKQILVVDVPSTMSAEEAEQMLNAVCDQGYSLRTITADSRAYFGLCCTVPKTRIAGHTTADIQRRIEQVLKSKGPSRRRHLYNFTNGRRDGTVNWDRALEGLVRDGLVGKTEGKFVWAKLEE